MIQSIQLVNFQKWIKLDLEFDRRVTTIIGETEAGKSTVFRALRWIGLNQFIGPADKLIHWNKSFARVILKIDAETILRKKGNANLYKLGDKEFRSFGANKVPDPVANILRLSEANFQSQLDQHFWISQSAGEISRELNQIVNLGSIDSSLSAIGTRYRQSQTELSVCEKRLDEAVKLRASLKWVDDADSRLIAIEKRGERIARLNALRDDLTATCKRLATYQDKSLLAGSEGDRASKLTKLAAKSIRLNESIKTLGKFIRTYHESQAAAKLQIKDPPNPKQLMRQKKRIDSLQTLLLKIDRYEDIVCQKSKVADTLAKRSSSMLGTNCPVCGKPLKAS